MYGCDRHPEHDRDPMPAWASHLLMHIVSVESRLDLLESLMTSFADDQAHLDSDIQSLTDAFTSFETIISGLKAQPGAETLDFTAADALVASVQAAVSADQPPASDPAPVTDPSTTPVDSTAPVDPSAPTA